MLLHAVLVAMVAAAGAACAAGAAKGTISMERFVETNVALRQVDVEAPDAAERRAAVLREHGVTEAQLRAFVEARSGDAVALAEVWEEIRVRLVAADSAAVADAAAVDSAAATTTSDTVAADSSASPAADTLRADSTLRAVLPRGPAVTTPRTAEAEPPSSRRRVRMQ